MARLAWQCVVVLAVGCGGSDYTPFFGGEGGANGSAGNTSGNSGDAQPGAGGSSSTGGSSPVGSGGDAMNGAGGATGTGGKNGSGGMTGSGGNAGAGGSGGGAAGMPDSGASGAGGMAGTPDAGTGGGCTSNDACPDTSYCKKSSCASDVRGTCTPKPKACMDDPEETPVCGCDGVTYFSSCLAEWSGENVALHGICGDSVGVKCTNANPACVNLPNGFCGYLLATAAGCPNGGGLPPVGRCWVLPDNCPVYANRFNTCNSGNLKCAGTCEAVKSERPVFRAPVTCN